MKIIGKKCLTKSGWWNCKYTNLHICDCFVTPIFDSVLNYGMLALMGSRYRSLYRFDCNFRTCIAAIEINIFCFHVILTDRYMLTTYVIKFQVPHVCHFLRLTVMHTKLLGIMSVDFDVTDQLLTRCCTWVRY